MYKPNSKISLAYGSLMLAATMTMAGCASIEPGGAPPLPPACSDPCPITIDLPNNESAPPVAPQTTVIKAGSEVNFVVPKGGGYPAGRTVLSFEKPVFKDKGKRDLLHTLELRNPNNSYETRDFEEGVCDEHPGCRYVVINVGVRGRPGIIASPRIIIIQ